MRLYGHLHELSARCSLLLTKGRTMSTDIKTLIAEARGRAGNEMGLSDQILRELADALEEEHRPVQGEPPATDARSKYTDAQMLYMLCLALEEGIEGVKRVDLDDLLLKMISEHWGTPDEDTSPDEAEAAFAQLEPHIPDHLRRPVQGESSGRMIDTYSRDDLRSAFGLQGDPLATEDHHPVGAYLPVGQLDGEWPCRTAQGEPTDAQVRYPNPNRRDDGFGLLGGAPR